MNTTLASTLKAHNKSLKSCVKKASHTRTKLNSQLGRLARRYECQMKIIISTIFLVCTTIVSAADYDKIYEGKYSWGPEVHSFTPCNNKTSYWVSFNWAGFEMHEFYKKNRKIGYQPMYVKFRGHLLDEVVDGFADQYDGLIHISEVKEYSLNLPSSCK